MSFSYKENAEKEVVKYLAQSRCSKIFVAWTVIMSAFAFPDERVESDALFIFSFSKKKTSLLSPGCPSSPEFP